MSAVLFNMRSSMTRTLKFNLSSLYKDNTRCWLKCININAVNQLAHLLQCQTIENQLSREEREHAHSVNYSDILAP